jgi:hypothetical protein
MLRRVIPLSALAKECQLLNSMLAGGETEMMALYWAIRRRTK